MMTEVSLIAQLDRRAPVITDSDWKLLAAMHLDDVQFDDRTIDLIREKESAESAGALAIVKARVESPLIRMLSNLRASIAEDTLRNEYDLHRRAHAWFAQGEVVDLDALDERVYAELFLTPSSDPWLGLLPSATFSALERGGVEIRAE